MLPESAVTGPERGLGWRNRDGNEFCTTADVDFQDHAPLPCDRQKPHQVVMDNLTWEASACFRLESSDVSAFYARNDHLGLLIPLRVHGHRPIVRTGLPGGLSGRRDRGIGRAS